MRVQHNIMAMNAYRNYNNNTKAIAKNLEKLSSGYRINRAGDDAAGLAISEKMRAQITGLATAQKNAKDGISLVQTAEGALTEVHSMLNRMFELAEQSANGTYDNEVDRANMQKEFDALRSEIDRIADSSNFNGKKLLDGSLDSSTSVSYTKAGNAAILQESNGTTGVHGTDTVLHSDAKAMVAAEFAVDIGNLSLLEATGAAGSTIGVTLKVGAAEFTLFTMTEGQQMDNETIKAEVQAWITANNGVVTSDADGYEFEVSLSDDGLLSFKQTNGDDPAVGHVSVNETVSFKGTGAAVGGTLKAETYDEATGDFATFNQATSQNVVGEDATLAIRANTEFELTTDMVKNGGTLTIGDTTYTFAVGKDSAFAGVNNVIDLTHLEAGSNLLLDAAGTLLSQQSNAMATIGYDKNSGNIVLEEKSGQKVADLSTYANFQNAVTFGTAKINEATGTSLTLQIGDTSEAFNQIGVSVKDMHCAALGIDAGSINISEQGMSQTAMDSIKAAINSVSSTRGDLGALQNRLDHTINNLGVMQENIQDAESTIRDTDVAAEMMAYTKNNILIQSAQAMLAQANQIPQGVLQLMG